MSLLDFCSRLIFALLLGSIIGLEREWRHRKAGLKTNALVSTGAALFVMISALTPGDSAPTRIAAQVVSGIGFLAGGVILREGLTIHGLNTAATIWCASAVGCLAGSGFFLHALSGSLVVLGSNITLRLLVHHIKQQPKGEDDEYIEIAYCCSIVCRQEDQVYVRTLLLQNIHNKNLLLRSFSTQNAPDPTMVLIKAELITSGTNDQLVEQVISILSLEPGVSAVSWTSCEANSRLNSYFS